MFLTAVIGISALGGTIIGVKCTSDYYETKLEEIRNDYVESIKNARAKEQEWYKKAQVIEEEYVQYQTKAQADATANAASLAKLRKQLSQLTTRVSQASGNSTSSAGKPSIEELASRISDLAEFGDRCAAEANKRNQQLEAIRKLQK